MGSRPWYAFYPADYERDTADLTLTQHGAYRRLIDHYYVARLLPASSNLNYRICRAFTLEEQAAVNHVVATYFIPADGGYSHRRIDEELEKSDKFSERGRRGGRASSTKRQLKSNKRVNLNPTKGSTKVQASQSQSHISTLPSNVDMPAKRSKRSLPLGFPEEKNLDWARTHWLQRGRTDLCGSMAEEIEQFRDHHSAKGTSSADWSGSWRTWVRNALKFNNRSNSNAGEKRTAHDKFFSATASLIRGLGEPGEAEIGEGDDSVGEIGRPLLPP